MPTAATPSAHLIASRRASPTLAGCTYVSPSGSKRWFCKYRSDGKEKQLALGSYPTVGLTAARKARDVAKMQRTQGRDPIEARKLEKLKGGIDRGDSFQAVALDWHGKQWNAELETVGARPVPLAGSAPMAGIEPMELVFVLQKVEERGALETADRALMLARQIWRYGLPTASNNQRDITEGLKSRLTPYHAKNFAAIVEPQRFGELLRAMHAYKGGCTALLCQRPGNLRMMEWAELDLDAGLRTLPSEKMKRTPGRRKKMASRTWCPCPCKRWICCESCTP